MMTHYEIKKMAKNIESINYIVENSTSFNLLKKYPYQKCMVMSERKTIFIPCINSINLPPNVVDLRINRNTTDIHTLKRREEYAKIILLLFLFNTV